jgi:hypothetical protein
MDKEEAARVLGAHIGIADLKPAEVVCLSTDAILDVCCSKTQLLNSKWAGSWRHESRAWYALLLT